MKAHYYRQIDDRKYLVPEKDIVQFDLVADKIDDYDDVFNRDKQLEELKKFKELGFDEFEWQDIYSVKLFLE